MNILVRYNADFKRMGYVRGIFVCTPEDIEKITDYGYIHFGEILGKHSDIRISFDKEDFEILTDDQDFIEKLIGYCTSKTISGYNPLSYMENEEF